MNGSFLLFWLPLHQNPSPFLKLQNQNFLVLFDQSLSRIRLSDSTDCSLPGSSACGIF